MIRPDETMVLLLDIVLEEVHAAVQLDLVEMEEDILDL